MAAATAVVKVFLLFSFRDLRVVRLPGAAENSCVLTLCVCACARARVRRRRTAGRRGCSTSPGCWPRPRRCGPGVSRARRFARAVRGSQERDDPRAPSVGLNSATIRARRSRASKARQSARAVQGPQKRDDPRAPSKGLKNAGQERGDEPHGETPPAGGARESSRSLVPPYLSRPPRVRGASPSP